MVFGLLTPDGQVDRDRTRELVERARPLAVTFHRAFDMAHDPRTAMEDLVAIGIDRVLTSGQEATAYEGMELIASLVQQSAGRLIIMPGGGIHERTIDTIIRRTGVTEVHVAALRVVESGMRFRNARCHMGGELRPPEFGLAVTEADTIRGLVGRARAAARV